MRDEKSAVYRKVTRWRVTWVDVQGKEHSKSFKRKPDAQAYLNKLTADIVRGAYVDPKKAGETFGSVAEDWYISKSHRQLNAGRLSRESWTPTSFPAGARYR